MTKLDEYLAQVSSSVVYDESRPAGELPLGNIPKLLAIVEVMRAALTEIGYQHDASESTEHARQALAKAEVIASE